MPSENTVSRIIQFTGTVGIVDQSDIAFFIQIHVSGSDRCRLCIEILHNFVSGCVLYKKYCHGLCIGKGGDELGFFTIIPLMLQAVLCMVLQNVESSPAFNSKVTFYPQLYPYFIL